MTTGDGIALAAYILGLVVTASSALGMLFVGQHFKGAWVAAAVFAALAIFLLVQFLAAQPLLLHRSQPVAAERRA
jgi:sugar phosphate permease